MLTKFVFPCLLFTAITQAARIQIRTGDNKVLFDQADGSQLKQFYIELNEDGSLIDEGFIKPTWQKSVENSSGGSNEMNRPYVSMMLVRT